MIVAFIFVLCYTISMLYSLIKNLQRIKTDTNFIVTWNNIIAMVFMLSVGIMAIINLPIIVIFGKIALTALNDYSEQRNAGKNPQFKAAAIGLKEKTDFWK